MIARPGPARVPAGLPLLTAAAVWALAGCAARSPSGAPEPSGAGTVDIGYGEVEKDRTVGAVSTSPAGGAGSEPFMTLAEMLRRTPGVRVVEQPGGRISVRIRGSNSSILGGEEPLFVLDGMALQDVEGLNSVDPNAIESITVLKDAGATAIYGSRGANGVILIRTKKGPERRE